MTDSTKTTGTTDLHKAVAEALLNAEWSGGYDRNGSHDAGAYCEYVEGITSFV